MPTTKTKTAGRRRVKRAGGGDRIDVELAKFVGGYLQERGLTQTEAAHIMRDAPSQVSLVAGGKLHGFSTKRLLRMVNRLGFDVRVIVRKSRFKLGTTRMHRSVNGS